jgi:hypothetical protein
MPQSNSAQSDRGDVESEGDCSDLDSIPGTTNEEIPEPMKPHDLEDTGDCGSNNAPVPGFYNPAGFGMGLNGLTRAEEIPTFEETIRRSIPS